MTLSLPQHLRTNQELQHKQAHCLLLVLLQPLMEIGCYSNCQVPGR